MGDDRREQTRYFWSGWFDGQSYALLAFVFSLLSFVDLLATLGLMPYGIREGNGLANVVLERYHAAGLVVFKVLIVLIVLLCTWLVNGKNERTSRLVLWAGCLIMSVIVLRHLAIFTRLTLHATGMFGY